MDLIADSVSDWKIALEKILKRREAVPLQLQGRQSVLHVIFKNKNIWFVIEAERICVIQY